MNAELYLYVLYIGTVFVPAFAIVFLGRLLHASGDAVSTLTSIWLSAGTALWLSYLLS